MSKETNCNLISSLLDLFTQCSVWVLYNFIYIQTHDVCVRSDLYVRFFATQ